MYRTYSYNDMPRPVTRQREEEKKPAPPRHENERHEKHEKHERHERCDEKKKGGFLDGIFGNMEADDIILLIVVLALIMDDCDDKLLLLALGFIFISEWL